MGEREEGGHSHDAPPYQGLAPFETGEANLFFGRTRATRNLVDRLARRLTEHGSILLVSGASGVGKSSLLRAGLIPALAEGMLPLAGSRDWPRLIVTPTANPFRTLAAAWTQAFGGDAEKTERRLRDVPHEAVPSPGRRLVLVVDQFEELFTLVSDERERQAFIGTLHALTEGPGGAAVIIGVRADYWDRCAAYPYFAEAIQDGQVIVEPMAEPDLRLAITGPAAAAGLKIETGLVEIILDDLRTGQAAADRYGAAALPLLSQALCNIWLKREDDTLTVLGYEKSGRVHDSVRRTADEALAELPADDRKAALRIFRRLTVITAGGQVARRRATLAELHAAASTRSGQGAGRGDGIAALLSGFAGRRLLTLHEDTVEIAHDALLTAWPTLRQWLEPDLAAQTVYDGLLDAAEQWAGNHRDPAFLYRGPRLLAVQDSRPRWDRDPDSFPPPGPTAERFIAASIREARRVSRRRRMVMTGLSVLSVAAICAAGAAVVAADEAVLQRARAISRQLAAQSEVTGDSTMSSLLAVAAWKIADTDEARNRVLNAATRTGRGTLTGHTRGVMALAFSADGSIVVTGSDDGTARIWDTATRRQIGAPIARARFDCSDVHLALSRDGRTLATACGGTVRFYDVVTRRELGPPLTHRDVVSALAFRPDGKTLVTGDFKGVVRQWDAATHRPHGLPMGRPDQGRELASIVRKVTFDRTGKVMAVASGKSVRLWDPATSRPLGAPIARQDDTVLDVAFSPDGGTLATVSHGKTALLWSVASGRRTGALRDRNAGFNAIVFSPDGTRIATAGGSGRMVLWDAASRERLLVLAGNVNVLECVAFSPDGNVVAAAGFDGVVRLADPRIRTQIGTRMPAQSAVALSRDGRTLATGAADENDPSIQLWDTATQRPAGPPLRPGGPRRPVSVIEFAPDGRTLLTSGSDGLRLWDLAARREIAHEPALRGLPRLSPDGRFVAVQVDQDIAFWDVARRTEIGPRIHLPSHTSVITALAISSDGKKLASAGADDRVRIFDVAARREIPAASPPASAGGLVNDLEFSPDGTKLAFTASDDTVRLWDVERRRPAGVALVNEDGPTSAMEFSPDGRVLATGSMGGGVQLWDLRIHRALGTAMSGHEGGVTSLAYSRDGASLATVGGDGAARLWNVRTPADLVAAACANAGRDLTREEWETLVREEEYRRTCP